MTKNNDSTIHIFINTDDNYAIPAYITLYSLIHNYHGSANVDIYVLCNDLSFKNVQLLRTISNFSRKFCIEFVEMKDEYKDVSININHISNAALYRLMIPRVVRQMGLRINKCIYLDTDVVVEGDISELYDLDLDWGNYYVAGVLDPCRFDNKYFDHHKLLGIPSMNKYINSGVLLLNLFQLNKDGISNKLEEAGYKNDFLHNDQDAINSVCYEGIKLIPLKFNAFRQLFYHNDQYIYDKYGETETIEAKRNPVIIHFIDRQKPWSNRFVLMSDKWWKYVKMQNKEVIDDYVCPFVKSKKAPLSERLVELCKKFFARLNTYDLIANFVNRVRKNT